MYNMFEFQRTGHRLNQHRCEEEEILSAEKGPIDIIDFRSLYFSVGESPGSRGDFRLHRGKVSKTNS